MKRWFCILMICMLLSGCGKPDPVPETVPATVETVQPSEAPTAAPETQPPEPMDPVDAWMQSMTLEEKVGQLFLARCPDYEPVEEITRYHLGGYILFDRDFDGRTPEAVREQIAAYQEESRIPLLIAVDEEGGSVCRVSSHAAFRPSRFPSPRSLYDKGGMETVLEAEAQKAELLHSLGINVNMAPVCDITDSRAGFMYQRSLGQSPEVTAEFAVQSHYFMQEAHVGAVLKHFPGYGNNADTHTGIAVDHRSLEELEQKDLIPFDRAIHAGAGAVLVSHTILDAFPGEYPASLSPEVHDYLRDTMGFTGVIVTDDLYMDAITRQYGVEEAAVLAVLAGNDLLCVTDYHRQYDAVLAAVQEERIPVEMIDTAAERILRWKQHLGLIGSVRTYK